MDSNLQHEDLLIKLRAKLNEEKIKLWEAPYYIHSSDSATKELQDLAQKYASVLSLEYDTVLQALQSLQKHSLERVKANEEFKESGVATLRIKATIPGERPRQFNMLNKLSITGSEFISATSKELKVEEARVKLIFNGRVINPSSSLDAQGIKNGVQIMALVMAETPDEVKQKDSMYMQMKSTRDDAMLLSEEANDMTDGDEYMKLEDQSGKSIQLPARERKALMVGMALHERGRTAVMQEDYPLALVLLLEADRQFSECNSSVLESVDNWALLQLDVAWCYLCLQNLSSAGDAAQRLTRAEQSFRRTYGPHMERLIAVKGNAANERVLLMRLYLLQGIVAYHQNRRNEARTLLDKAEMELNALRVDERGVSALMELGWSAAQARSGLRACVGDVNRAHQYLEELKAEKEEARRATRLSRQASGGAPVSERHVATLLEMGFGRRAAVAALRTCGNNVAEAARLIHDRPWMIQDSTDSSQSSSESDVSIVEANSALLEKLVTMGYDRQHASKALRIAHNKLAGAVDMLVDGGGAIDSDNKIDKSPTTSGGEGTSSERQSKSKCQERKKARDEALERLSSAIKTDEDDHYDTSLQQEEQFLVQYKSLL